MSEEEEVTVQWYSLPRTQKSWLWWSQHAPTRTQEMGQDRHYMDNFIIVGDREFCTLFQIISIIHWNLKIIKIQLKYFFKKIDSNRSYLNQIVKN